MTPTQQELRVRLLAHKVRIVLASLLVYTVCWILWSCRWVVLLCSLLLCGCRSDAGKVMRQLGQATRRHIEALYTSEDLLRISLMLTLVCESILNQSVWQYIDFVLDGCYRVGSWLITMLGWMDTNSSPRIHRRAGRVVALANYERQHGPLAKADWQDDDEEGEFLEYLKIAHPGIRFDCPITKEVMTNPVVAADGFTYEAHAIIAWLNMSSHLCSPMTGRPLPSAHLMPNRTLRAMIEDQKCAFRAAKSNRRYRTSSAAWPSFRAWIKDRMT
eukprot:Blabericola_migrator_1__1205@NODE_1309_length_4841_cov_86_500628_g881_i0_p4_GENE_NODE_1309_length_4841_cov_86_500628_g881_i0NODE_1309_length_4841_cov_86_500628_g881_i0_p4_ORF_typecomplete_len273_score10_81Ubox/PF04564_15/1_4e19zfNse/PF11789_8/8_7e06_NODE_1309_length_4841_cov_86_500628_g881_i039014719